MNVLVIGNGAREHALAWRISRSPSLTRLWVAPGNYGTGCIATNLDAGDGSVAALTDAAREVSADLVVVGPEAPLADGLAVKANGLAAGKGVTVCDDEAQAAAAVRACMSGRAFGDAGATALLEERLEGREVSVFAFCDGEHISPLVAACDYKRLNDGDGGPNTGGMGSYSPPQFWRPELCAEVERTIMRPVVSAMAARGAPYRGVLYAGLMLTADGPKVLEFNCRFGDPETQTLMPRLASDPLELMLACSEGNLDRVSVCWDDRDYVGVVMASGGYPDKYSTGFEISGLGAETGDTDNSLMFTAGVTAGPSGRPVTAGGRVLTVVGGGRSIAEARERAYARLGGIAFQGAHWRTDIGLIA